MSKSSEAVIRWRNRLKSKMVAAMGGKCQCCGYAICNDALEFHHINPEEKEFTFGRIKANPKNREKIINELKKCILLCSNCHREIHSGCRQIPEVYAEFDDSLIKSEYELRKNMRKQQIVITQPVVDRRKIYLTDEQLHDILSTQFNGNKSALARSLNVSEAAIRKRLKKCSNIHT